MASSSVVTVISKPDRSLESAHRFWITPLKPIVQQKNLSTITCSCEDDPLIMNFYRRKHPEKNPIRELLIIYRPDDTIPIFRMIIMFNESSARDVFSNEMDKQNPSARSWKEEGKTSYFIEVKYDKEGFKEMRTYINVLFQSMYNIDRIPECVYTALMNEFTIGEAPDDNERKAPQPTTTTTDSWENISTANVNNVWETVRGKNKNKK